LQAANRVYRSGLKRANRVREGYIKRGRQRGLIQDNDDGETINYADFDIRDWDEPFDPSEIAKSGEGREFNLDGRSAREEAENIDAWVMKKYNLTDESQITDEMAMEYYKRKQ